MGCSTALLTLRRDQIATMPCNPSIGGIAKSHLVFEIDALGGEMATNTDCTGIQFRVLNTRKGPAVHSTRVQCDKDAYARRMQRVLARISRLTILEAEVTALWTEYGRLRGVTLADETRLEASCVVICTGTYLNGRIFVGDRSRPGGTGDAPPSDRLSDSLRQLGFSLHRLKTGTPPRLDAQTLRWAAMERQEGTFPAPLLSWKVRREAALFHVEQTAGNSPPQPRRPSGVDQLFHVEQDPVLRPWTPGADPVPCYLTRTTPRTHEIIRDNLQRSSLYGGHITGTGARYCPSVEDKIVKFAGKDTHHVFIEPEGRSSNLIYPNGLSNSLPEEVQEALIHSVPGLEAARILKYAYAIEYDFSDPTQLSLSLESKAVAGLFFAGQINGTTGYEEAGAQGLVAGINAARKARGQGPVTFARDEAYLGVMIDDLVTRGTSEPYRMFTSRAERRLLLRQDNARYRLLAKAQEIGIADPAFLKETQDSQVRITSERARLEATRQAGVTLAQVLRRPEVRYRDLPGADPAMNPETVLQIEIQTKYEGYLLQEVTEANKARHLAHVRIPEGFDYHQIPSLRFEAREKLGRIRPVDLGQASRIPGLTPADLTLIRVAIERNRPRRQRGNEDEDLPL